MNVEDTHHTWEEASDILQALASGNLLLQRVLKRTYVNDCLWNTRASNPALPALLIGSKDVSTAKRQKGLQDFSDKLFRSEDFDSMAVHPECWYKSKNKNAIIIVAAWSGSTVNTNNWLYGEYEVEYEEAELGQGEIQALNDVVHAAGAEPPLHELTTLAKVQRVEEVHRKLQQRRRRLRVARI